jgi:cation diffusion facilitator family transporter
MATELNLPGTTPLAQPILSRGQRIVMAGLISNIVLAGLQISAGWYGQSRAVLADGIHSSSDILISLLVLVSLGIARKPADESHPFGHGKAESIAAFLVGLIIAAVGLGLIYDALYTIAGGIETIPGILPFAVACISIATKASLYYVTIRIGRQLSSPGVLAAAQEYRSCVACSSSALAGVLAAWLGFPAADSLAGILVAGFLLKMAGETLWNSTQDLMDAGLTAEYVEIIRSTAGKIKGVRGVPTVRTRRMGSRYLVDLDISTDSDIVVEEADRVAAQIKRQIVERIREAAEVRVFISPTEEEAAQRRETEASIRWIIQQHADRFVSFEELRITRLGRDACADFTVVLPKQDRVEEAYVVCADLEKAIKEQYPEVEVIIRLQMAQTERIDRVPA